MSGAPRPVVPRYATLMLGLARSVVPDPYVLDACYPASPFLLSGETVELCWSPETVSDAAPEFYASFRQGGGTRPILPFVKALPAAQAAAGGAGVSLLVAIDDGHGLAAARLLKRGADLPALLLLGIGQVREVWQELRDIGYQGHCKVQLLHGDHQESFCFVSPVLDGAALVQAFETAGKAVAVDMRLAALEPDGEPDTVVVVLPEAYHTWTDSSITPLALVHDGSRTAEGDTAYSWLWCAGRNQLRMILGPVNGRYRRLRVIVPDALSATNLTGARLLLNGEVVPTRVEIWSDTSGAIWAELPGDLAEPLILGLWVPEGKLMDDGVTRLHACIDRVELSA